VDAVGFAQVGPYAPFLSEAIVCKNGEGKTLVPVVATADEARNGHHDARLVTITASLEADESKGQRPVLLLKAGETHFVASFPDRASAGRLNLKEASLLRLNGICAVEVDDNKRPVSVTATVCTRCRGDPESTLVDTRACIAFAGDSFHCWSTRCRLGVLAPA
jgi:hypothetical protein